MAYDSLEMETDVMEYTGPHLRYADNFLTR